MSTPKRVPKGNGLLPPALAKRFAMLSYVVAALGVALGVGGFLTNKERFGYSYLVGFIVTMTISVGALFFVVIQHLTKSSWSVAPRRTLEWISQGATALPALFIPLVALAPTIWNKWMGPEALEDTLVKAKSAYLNKGFFFTRAAVFLLVWAALAHFFYKNSRDQDLTGDRKHSTRLQTFAAPATALLGLSITFAGFDWVMSLSPHWYSTIFGVYIFAGSIITALAVLAIVVVRYRQHNVGGDLLTVEHQHDVGKFLFGFVIFWAYIGFSQFILIFYANIPEETIFYRVRWQGGWDVVSLSLLFGHFVVPFLLLLSRTAKRTNLLALGAAIIIVMHVVDVYWMVMPNLTKGEEHSKFAFSWIDLGGLLAPVGLAMAWVSYRVLGDPAYPLKDPYTAEALKAENL
ncbi:MAG: hypothetical protein U0414_35015 [Polyangiaceae bacterium]